MKELREGCERHGLPTSGSKSKLFMRLGNFRTDLKAKMQTELARKLYRERERKPVALNIPKKPTLAEQQEQPHALPVRRMVPSLLEHKVHKRDARKEVISFDFGYTYDYGNERSSEEVKDAGDQYGTVLCAADHHKRQRWQFVVGLQVAGGDPVAMERDR